MIKKILLFLEGVDNISMSLKKHWLKMATYVDKNCLKHKHDYKVKHLLIVTNINKHASGNYYNSKDYYYVLKCDKCDSFIPDSIPGNFDHHIFSNEDVDFSLPTILANTKQKNLIYDFCKLEDVVVKS